MKSIVKNITNYVICLSVIAILLGIVLIAYPQMSLTVLGIVVGAYLIVLGVMLIILDIRAWRLYIPFEGMLKGILSVVIGVLLVKNPESFATYLGILLGVWIIVSSFDGIKVAAALRLTNAPWVLMIILNVLTIILGCFILFSPTIYALSFTMYIGIVLIVYSVINIVYMIMIKKNAKDVEKIIEEKVAVLENDADIEAED